MLEFEWLAKEPTLSIDPKEPWFFLPLEETLTVEEPGACVYLTFFFRFIVIP